MASSEEILADARRRAQEAATTLPASGSGDHCQVGQGQGAVHRGRTFRKRGSPSTSWGACRPFRPARAYTRSRMKPHPSPVTRSTRERPAWRAMRCSGLSQRPARHPGSRRRRSNAYGWVVDRRAPLSGNAALGAARLHRPAFAPTKRKYREAPRRHRSRVSPRPTFRRLPPAPAPSFRASALLRCPQGLVLCPQATQEDCTLANLSGAVQHVAHADLAAPWLRNGVARFCSSAAPASAPLLTAPGLRLRSPGSVALTSSGAVAKRGRIPPIRYAA